MTVPRSHTSTFSQLVDRRRLTHVLKAHDRLLVAVSGGADSVALLRALHQCLPSEVYLAAVHVNHGLRPEAAAEQQFVEDLCIRMQIPLHVVGLTNADANRSGSAEAHWRHLRYQEFSRLTADHGYTALALGHTADDLAETFLFHLIRGTGVAGLTFHFEKSHDGLRLLRPLWQTTRGAIEATLRHHQQPWLEDPSNADLRHTRNRIRHTIMPALQQINPDATGAIVRAAMAIDQLSPENDPGLPAPALDFTPLRRFPLSHGQLSHALRFFAAAHEIRLSSRQIEQASAMIAENRVGLVALTGSATLVVTQEFAWILHENQPQISTLARAHTEIFSGLYVHNPVGKGFSRHTTVQALDGKSYDVTVSGDAATYSLRSREPGDRLGSRPLKHFFNEQKIPWYLRDFVPLLLAPDSQIIAVLSTTTAITDASLRKSGSTARVEIQLQL